MQEQNSSERALRKIEVGRVVSDSMDKTVVVEVKHAVKHSGYGKIVNRSNRFKAHDDSNDANVGDLVRIMETRPLSKTKRWRVVEIVERAK
jgi:small subunit ribosomal protein S17